MRIKTYECKRFAGLKDLTIEFEEGINVILGDNESGKSTIIEGIHSTLFKDTRLRNNNNADKEFSFKFMPRPSGDFIDGRLVVGMEDGDFEIYKEWGSNENIYLVDQNGSIIKDKKDIKMEMARLLNYGESTYSNIVFAKQRDLKKAIGNIIENSQLTSEVNDLLRQTMMELDGISIDKLEKDIELEIEKLYKRWDRVKNYPENNKGISNPYKTGLGEILDSYYKKEGLKLSMEKADKSEKEFERICSDIKELKDKREILNKEKVDLEKIEEDVNTREILETKTYSINKDLEDLALANREWPVTEELINQLNEKTGLLKHKREDLRKEKKDMERAKKKDDLGKKLKKIEDIEANIGKIDEAISQISKISKEEIDDLKDLQKEILTLETTIRASKMLGRLKKSGDKDVYISRDFEGEEIIDANTSFEANGAINIRYDDLEIEIKSGDEGFKESNNNYKLAKKTYSDRLNDLKVDSLEVAILNFEEIRSKLEEKKSLVRDVESILDENTRENLENSFKELEDIKPSRYLDEIEAELETLNSQEVDLLSDKRTKENQIEFWKDKFTDHDSLFDMIVDKKVRLKEKKNRLESLKPLPDDFSSIEDFKSRLRYLKEETKNLDIRLEELSGEKYDAKGSLLDDTFEELKKEHLEAETVFEKNIKRGEKLLEIQRVFLKTKRELSNNPMEPLVDEFSRILELITDGSYQGGDIDEDFNIRLENNSGEIPVDLLSAGTYDAVSLALRFSLLKHIFKDRGGYVVLDDCLVDLDPDRKQQSVNLINDLAEDYQIIFTTCDPDTAHMLGGNIIRI